MTHQPLQPLPANAAGQQVAQLAEVQALIGGIAGRSAPADLDRAATISAAYDAAPSIAQRRFDTLAAECAAWAAAGVEAIVAKEGPHPRAAAACLFDELERAQVKLARMIGA